MQTAGRRQAGAAPQRPHAPLQRPGVRAAAAHMRARRGACALARQERGRRARVQARAEELEAQLATETAAAAEQAARLQAAAAERLRAAANAATRAGAAERREAAAAAQLAAMQARPAREDPGRIGTAGWKWRTERVSGWRVLRGCPGHGSSVCGCSCATQIIEKCHCGAAQPRRRRACMQRSRAACRI